jgi:hypothetical protein
MLSEVLLLDRERGSRRLLINSFPSRKIKACLRGYSIFVQQQRLEDEQCSVNE